MEKGPAPPPGGATDSKNPDEKPRAFQMDSENTSTSHSKTLTVADLQAPTEGFSFFDTPTPNPGQNPVDTPADNPLAPANPPPLPIDDEADLMQDIRSAVLPQTMTTQKTNPPDSPTTRVSTGVWGELPELQYAPAYDTICGPVYNNNKTPDQMVTQKSPGTPGTKEGSPHLVTPQMKDSPPKDCLLCG